MAAVEMPEVLHPSVIVVLPENENKGTVVQAPGGTGMQIGDVVLINEETPVEVEIDDVTHRIVKESSIYGWYTRVSRAAPEQI